LNRKLGLVQLRARVESSSAGLAGRVFEPAKGGRIGAEVSDVVEQLKLRVLAEHGGPTGTSIGWNLTHGDSIMHREALAEIERLHQAHQCAVEIGAQYAAALDLAHKELLRVREALAAALPLAEEEWPQREFYDTVGAECVRGMRAALDLCVKCGLPPGCPDCKALNDAPEGA
jgi:hypothetical protein